MLREMHESMNRFYENRAPQEWWPEDPLEVIVGAVLVQGTKWSNVSRVLDELKADGLLDWNEFARIKLEDLQQRIRSVGFQQRKAPALKGVFGFLHERFPGGPEDFFSQEPEEIRSQLLSIKGIGRQTAENILLYGAKKDVYAVDKFTFRIFLRHGMIGKRSREGDIKRIIERELPPGAKEYNEFQSLVVRIGRDFCGKTDPKCSDCPLEPLLPEGGPLECLFESVSTKSGSFASHGFSRPRLFHSSETADPSYHGARDSISQGEWESGLSSDVAMRNTPRSVPPNFPTPIEGLDLSDMECSVIALVRVEGTPIDEVITCSGLPTGTVLATLSILEMKKLVRRREGNLVARM